MIVKDNERYDNKPNLYIYKLLDRRGRGFTMVDNSITANVYGLSVYAMAVYMYMQSKCDEGWHLNIAAMNRCLNISAYKSCKARTELVEKGFLVQKEIRRNGRKAYEYTIYELPKDVLNSLNQRTENYVQKTESRKLTAENATHNNTYSNNDIINNKQLKDNNHICKTEVCAKGINPLENSSKDVNSSVDSEHVSHAYSNTNSIDEPKISKDVENAEVNLDRHSEQINALNKQINKAEAKLEELETRAKRRIRNEKEVHRYIESLDDISEEIKQLLKDYVSSWKDKGRKITVIELNTLLQELKEKSKTEYEQINSIKTAISCGYRMFFPAKKIESTDKSSNLPQFNFDDETESK